MLQFAIITIHWEVRVYEKLVGTQYEDVDDEKDIDRDDECNVDGVEEVNDNEHDEAISQYLLFSHLCPLCRSGGQTRKLVVQVSYENAGLYH